MGLPSSSMALMRACAISRATISVPDKFRRVLTGYFLSSFKTSSIGWSRSMFTAGLMPGSLPVRNEPGSFQLFQEDTVFRDFSFDVPIGTTTYTDTHGAGCRVTRHTDDTHVVYPVFTPKLGPDTHVLTDFLNFGFPFQIPECLTAIIPFGWKIIIISRRCFLYGCQTGLGRGSPDNYCQMVGRTG